MPSQELEAALAAARAAAAILAAARGRPPEVRWKDDGSPVTDVDVRAEEAIREVLLRRFPAHGFYGEETGRHRGDGESLWLVDPIDGTRCFVRGIPFYSTQIALMRAGELVVGVSYAPVFDELAHAERGAGAFLNGERLRVSGVATLREAHVSTGNVRSIARSARWERLGALAAEVACYRGYGDFIHYHLLARGAIEAVIECDLTILDFAALAVIVREAGGVFTDLDGAPVGLETTTVLAANGALHAPLAAALRP